MEGQGSRPLDDSLQGQFEELWRRASKDSLTGLLNRETLEQHIRDRIDSMEPADDCALIIIDLDDFKRVNDTFGHKTGDNVIHRAAQVLSSLFRASDIVGRLGGDEFAVFICGSEVDEEAVRRMGAGICDALQITLGDNSSMSLTASVGIYISKGPQDFDGLYQAADLALYKAKKAGKHRYCIKSQGRYKEDLEAGGRAVGAIGMTELLEDLDCGIALMELGEPIRLTFVSPSFCRLLGASKDGLPTPVDMQSLVHPDDEAGLERVFYAAATSDSPAEITVRMASADGRGWLWWHLRAARLPYDGNPPLMLLSANDISLYKGGQEKLEETRCMLESAFFQTNQRLWEVDMQTQRLRAHKAGPSFYEGEPDEGLVFPDDLIETGFIHPSAVARFREFASELLTGQAQGYGSFIIRSQDGLGYGWVALSYRMLFDEAGAATKAIGVASDLSDTFTSQGTGIVPHRLLPEALLADLMVRMRLDLSQDRVEELWLEGQSMERRIGTVAASSLLGGKRSKVFNEDDRKSLGPLFDISQLLELHSKGQDWFDVWYDRADCGGNIRHVRHVFHLLEGPLTNDCYLNSYLIRVNLPASWHEVLRNSGAGSQAGLWSSDIMEAVAEAAFKDPSGAPSVAVLQLCGVDAGRLGALQTALACSLGTALGGSCLIGRLSAERLVMLFPASLSRPMLRRRLEEALVFIRRVVDELSVQARLVVGVSMPSTVTSAYAGLLADAAYVCSLWWNASADTVAFLDDIDDKGWTGAQSQYAGDSVSVMSHELERPLSEGEKDAAFSCMGAMLSANSLESSVLGVLRTIGLYYQADRVYLLILTSQDMAVTMPYEWTSIGKPSIQNVVSGMKLERFPILQRCLKEKAPVFLSRNRPGSDETWCFTAVPLIRKERPGIEGMLCIENAKEHTGNAALFGAVIPYMLREQERFHSSGSLGGSVEQLMGLPDLRSYMNRVYSLNNSRYSSLGAVCLDIPSMASINGMHGFEYGNRLLWFVSKTLSDLFGQGLMFRTWEAEFVVFYPNTTKQVFLGRCGRLRSILQRRYPGEVRIGNAWSDGVFTGRQLVEEARCAMDADASAYKKAARFIDVTSMTEDETPLKITLHYQPKVDMRTGRLVGCEALVRALEDDGTLLAPERFIGQLEERGGIREMDMYVLDMALSQVESWKEAGLPLIPIAVNFSRVTLSHPSTLASVMATQSRHTSVPSDALEIEVTESAEVMDNAQFRQIVDRFREAGLHVGLDDFGSRYANMAIFTDVTFDTVKLDRSLISGIVGNPVNRMLVRDLVRICRSRGMDCVAEGVETEEQRVALVDTGCLTAQGYLFDRPLPAEVFERKYLRPQVQEEII